MPQDKNEYNREHYYKTHSHQRERSKAYYDTHREERLVKNRAYSQSLKGKWNTFKCQVRARGLENNLTFEEYSSFWQKPCYHCGTPIATIGIDRLDSSINYTLDNSVSCCAHCNYMKLDYTEDEWIAQMLTILKHKGVY